MKTCNTCNVEKPLDEFRLYLKKGKSYRLHKCKSCAYQADNTRRKASDTHKETVKAWRRTPKGMMTARRGSWKRNGIDPDKAEAYFLAHHGLCDLCGKDVEANGKALAIDHCHETGYIRGMLCSNCNRGIGLLNDDYSLILKAARYVKRLRDLNTGGTLKDLDNGGTLRDLAVSGDFNGGRTDITGETR